MSWTRVFAGLARFIGSRRGNVSVIMTMTLVPVIGAIGMGAEATNWFLTQRAIQNAADAAVIAAATNNCDENASCETATLQANYKEEARSVADKFGFLNSGDTTVAPSIEACISPATGSCYQVAITRKVPFYLLRIVGFEGDTTTTLGTTAQTVSAVAQAKRFPGSAFCVTALGNGTQANTYAIRLNGASNVHFENCDAFTPNSGSWCSSSNASTAFRSAVMGIPTFNQACPSAPAQASPFVDNFDDLESSIPSSCGTTPNSALTISVATEADLVGCKNGNVTLTQNIEVAGEKTLIIFDGSLDLNGYTLSTVGDGSLTIIFTSNYSTGVPSSFGNRLYAVTAPNGKDSALNIRAPTSGTWSGIAIYQDPSLVPNGNKVNLDFDYQSKKIDIKYSGMFYAPKAYFNTNGNSFLTYATNGTDCLAMIVYRFQVSGAVTASTNGCTAAGLNNLPRVDNLVNLVA